VEAWGRVTPGGPVELLGCEQVDLFADTVTIINVGPLRADGATSCPM
jgi:hypothetical protein